MHASFHEAKLVSSTVERKTGRIYCNLKRRLLAKHSKLKKCTATLVNIPPIFQNHSYYSGSSILSVLLTFCETSHIPVVYHM